ncbi:hypothetical protein [Azomonas macrocytogenes]|uniref:Uncharacterized protein n=1 Tax=Azomonas macrocytogenes TaxID=69962 RepID=A0A839T7C0_AZOMA|nr:hypothetical protein [Azomonas macrocytogenes]MBB3105397.1 hypothetical protein [Azomonas macrocytogenes]
MRPYYPEDDAKWKVKGHGDRVEVSITNNGSDTWYKAWQGIKQNELINSTVVSGSDIYGLSRFIGVRSDEYSPVAGQDLIITCRRLKEGPSPSCMTKSNYRKGRALEYYYGLGYLQSWSEIDISLKSIFDSFSQATQTDQSKMK